MNDLIDGRSPTVCFFDSGIGGLSLLCECVTRIPDKKFIYFADNYNVPYGNLPQDKILKKVEAVFEEIAKLNPSAAVLACNTVTARCATELRREYAFPIIGIQPAIKPAAATARNCLVLATVSTASSPSVTELVSRFGRGITRVEACPNLASYIENNIDNLDEARVLSLLPDVDADAVVLGCTHYSLVKKTVGAKYGCNVFDGLEGTARHLCNVLGSCGYFGTDYRNVSDRVAFIGGDEEKNRKVFELILSGRPNPT